MRWVTEIEKLNKARIVTKLDPLNNTFDVCGQYSIKGMWIDFVTKKIDIETNKNNDPESLYITIGDVCEELKEKIVNYELINEKLKEMKWIEMKD
jgi:hypothetical protein